MFVWFNVYLDFFSDIVSISSHANVLLLSRIFFFIKFTKKRPPAMAATGPILLKV